MLEKYSPDMDIDVAFVPHDYNYRYGDPFGISDRVTRVRRFKSEVGKFSSSEWDILRVNKAKKELEKREFAGEGLNYRSSLCGDIKKLSQIESVRLSNWMTMKRGVDFDLAQLDSFDLSIEDDGDGNYCIDGIFPDGPILVPKYEFDCAPGNFNDASVQSFLDLDIDAISSTHELVQIHEMLVGLLRDLRKRAGKKDYFDRRESFKDIIIDSREKMADSLSNRRISSMFRLIIDAVSDSVKNVFCPEMKMCRELDEVLDEVYAKLFGYMKGLMGELMGVSQPIDLPDDEICLDIHHCGGLFDACRRHSDINFDIDDFILTIWPKKHFDNYPDHSDLLMIPSGLEEKVNREIRRMIADGHLRGGNLGTRKASDTGDNRFLGFWVSAPDSTVFSQQEEEASDL